MQATRAITVATIAYPNLFWGCYVSRHVCHHDYKGDSMGIEFFLIVCFVLNRVNEHDTCLQSGEYACFDYKSVPSFHPHPSGIFLQPLSLGSSHDAFKLLVAYNEQSTVYLGVRPGCRYCTQKAARS